jgi:D-serine deaminase-like pyridoxal phosphate-dependent protein
VDVSALKTPCALVDLDRFERNCRRMADRAHALGVRLRPHVKTHKCVEAAGVQTRDHFGGITVSTLAEARGFADGGFRDITYAVPVPLDRLDECADLTRRLGRFHLVLDHRATLAALEEFAAASGVQFSVFLKVDCGLHRAGVDPTREESISLAQRMHASKHLEFTGILTHGGHSYGSRSAKDARIVAEQERDVMVQFRERLLAAGVSVPEVSVGSTPTASSADDLTGVTEIRPGNYAFFDAFQVAIGSCRVDDVAFSVFATAIGRNDDRQELVVNAGATALGKDPGPVHVDAECGFGVVVAGGQQVPVQELVIASLSQEHGVIRSNRPLDRSWQPGSRLRILPNHSCLAAACFDRYHVVRGDEVVDEWRPLRGW